MVASCNGGGAVGARTTEAPEQVDASEPALPSSEADSLRLADFGGTGRFHLEEPTIADILRAKQRAETQSV